MMGKNEREAQEGGDILVFILLAESCHYTAETITVLQSNYFPIKKFKNDASSMTPSQIFSEKHY